MELNSASIMEKNLNQTKEIEKLIEVQQKNERLMNEKDMELNETSKLLLVKTIVLEEIVSKKAMIEKALIIRNEEFEELSKVNQIMKALGSPDSEYGDELHKTFVKLMEKLDTLNSVKEENERLKKANNSANNMLQDNAITLELTGKNNARIQRDWKTRCKEIFELRKEMESLRASLEKVTLERDDLQKELDLKKRDKATAT